VITTTLSVDPDQLAHHIAAMYRDVANETGRDLHFHTGRALAETLGYPGDLLDRLPPQAVSSFAGVGYHFGLAHLVEGERVLDLGSGSGMDVFAAAVEAGPTGSVVGVDITPEQLAKAERLRREVAVLYALQEVRTPNVVRLLPAGEDGVVGPLPGVLSYREGRTTLYCALEVLPCRSAGNLLNDVLQHVSMSRRVFETEFKKLFGRMPHEEIVRTRIQRVKELLVQTDLPLYAVAERAGFKHVEYMSVVFKKKVGIPPSEYRERRGR